MSHVENIPVDGIKTDSSASDKNRSVKSTESIVRALNLAVPKGEARTFALADGRNITVQEPAGNIKFKSAMIIPSNKSDNIQLLNLIQASMYVQQIGDKKFTIPQTMNEVQAILDCLEDEGVLQLQMRLEDYFPLSDTVRTELERRQVRNL